MSGEFKLKEVRVDLPSGVTVIADVASVDGLRSLLSQLAELRLMTPPQDGGKKKNQAPPGGDLGQPEDSPIARVETRAELESGSLSNSNLLAFKDDVPQLLRPGGVSVTEALLLLLFACEAGLQKAKIDYESFKDLYEAQNIKSGSPLSMRLTDLRNGGYLDKKAYQADRSLRLTAKGEKKAVEILKKKQAE